MFVSIIYEIALILLSILAFPKLIYDFFIKRKYRHSFLKRFGSGFPDIHKGERPLIWIHAVSLGETKAVATLAKRLKIEMKHALVIFSTTTETGHVEACRSIPADYHVYLPFDFGWVIKPIVNRVKPDLVILCESDFWFNFLRSSKKVGAHVVLVNGKISERSANRFKKFPKFSHTLFSTIDLFCVQSNLYQKRFESVGVAANKITVTGNMKFDGDFSKLPSEQLTIWRKELGIKATDPVIVIGSSHNPEETLLLKVMSAVWSKHPDLKLMIVPRHPERFNEVAGILQKNNVNFRRLSQKSCENVHTPVILIDAMGLLRKCYQLATIAIVAGSYTNRVGGHNILEPSWYGVPVIFGPHMHSQPDLVDLIKEYGAGLQVSTDELAEVLSSCLKDPDQCKQIGEAGLRLVSDIHGATDQTFKAVKRSFERL